MRTCRQRSSGWISILYSNCWICLFSSQSLWWNIPLNLLLSLASDFAPLYRHHPEWTKTMLQPENSSLPILSGYRHVVRYDVCALIETTSYCKSCRVWITSLSSWGSSSSETSFFILCDGSGASSIASYSFFYIAQIKLPYLVEILYCQHLWCSNIYIYEYYISIYWLFNIEILYIIIDKPFKLQIQLLNYFYPDEISI